MAISESEDLGKGLKWTRNQWISAYMNREWARASLYPFLGYGGEESSKGREILKCAFLEVRRAEIII